MAKHGGKRKGAGRKSKAEEQALIEKLSPLEEEVHVQLKKAIEKGERWAIKMYFEYMYGKAPDKIDVTSKGDKISGVTYVVKRGDKD